MIGTYVLSSGYYDAYYLKAQKVRKLIKIDLKINSMRVKKFTTPTYFIADKIRNKGYKQNTSIKKAFLKTNLWIGSVDINSLRKIITLFLSFVLYDLI